MLLKSNEQGTTLIETLVAIALAIVVVVAMVSLGISSQRNANFAKNQLVASKLSQEGMEAVRSVRDNGGSNLISSCFSNTTWNGLWNDQVNTLCGGTLFILSFDSVNNVWDLIRDNLPETVQTIFSRQVSITDDASTYSYQKVVTVTTTWVDSSGTHNSQVVDYLTKWKQ